LNQEYKKKKINAKKVSRLLICFLTGSQDIIEYFSFIKVDKIKKKKKF
jgi:hypothetical protein